MRVRSDWVLVVAMHGNNEALDTWFPIVYEHGNEGNEDTYVLEKVKLLMQIYYKQRVHEGM